MIYSIFRSRTSFYIREWNKSLSVTPKGKYKTLEEARASLPDGLTRLDHNNKDKLLIESWYSGELPLQLELVDLKYKWINKISEECSNFENRLAEEMTAELSKVINGRKYLGYCGDGVEGTAKMFVNNWITMSSIWDDPSGDWDGSPRAENLEEYIEEQS